MNQIFAPPPQPLPSLTAVAQCALPTPWAEFRLLGFRDPRDGREHLALVLGEVAGGAPVLARLHSECLTGDGLFSQRCDCGAQLERALQKIAAAGRGVVLYLRQEGRGIGLIDKIRAYALQDQGLDTVDANLALGLPVDSRDYSVAAAMLRSLGIAAVRLLSNNPEKAAALVANGIGVSAEVGHVAGVNRYNRRYLATKASRLGHRLPTALADAA